MALTLVFVAAVARIAVLARRLTCPGWDGAPARLVEAVLGVAAATTLGLVLGTFGLLGPAALVVAALAVLAVVEWRFGRWAGGSVASSAGAAPAALAPGREAVALPGPASPGHGRGAVIAAVAVAVAVFAHWGLATSWSLDHGITNFDSVWYHLPFSAEIAQSGSTLGLHRSETVFLNWFYPQGSELLHALGMVLTGRDTLSLAINLGWLGLALLAAWCVGRPYGRGHLTVAAAAVLLECHNLVAREPGTAKNDIVGLALLLAAVAILVNWRGLAAGRLGPLLVAALATGLAAGVKVTALAPAFGITLAAIAISPRGRRLAASGWWAAGLALGGAYWYLRNLVVAGNPIPQLRDLGPLNLPGPDRLQVGRPDFTVAHYLFDGTVWSDYLLPGLERGFGRIWPLVLAAALAGGLLAVVRVLGAGGKARSRRQDGHAQALAWLGLAALIGIVAYIFTPLSAAGPEGHPTAFAINLRFAIPSLVIGLVLLPVALPRLGRRGGWAVFAAFVLLCLLSTDLVDILTEQGRVFGWAVALGLVVVPALLCGFAGRRFALLGAALLLAGLVALGYPLQRHYLEHRYQDFEPEQGLAEVYRWASDRSDTAIGLAGTTAGFHGYGFYGRDLSNRVTYLGAEAPAGGFDPISTCPDFRAAVNAADLDYLVTTPFLNFLDVAAPVPSPESRWIAQDPAVAREIEGAGVILWRITAPLDPAACGPAESPLREIPQTPLP